MKGCILYHLSPIRNRESILKNGLVPKSKNGKVIKYRSKIFFFSDKKTPPFDVVSFFDVDMWEVKIDKQKLKNDKLIMKSSGGGRWLHTSEKIHPTKIKLVKTFI